MTENNKPPQADAGPDKELTLPVDSTILDGSRSTDDQKIDSYLWEKTKFVFFQYMIKTKTGVCRAQYWNLSEPDQIQHVLKRTKVRTSLGSRALTFMLDHRTPNLIPSMKPKIYQIQEQICIILQLTSPEVEDDLIKAEFYP